MNLTQLFLAELKQEAQNTKRMLEAVPTESLDWKPHEKSMTLGRLAAHTAEMTSWIKLIINDAELDFTKFNYKAPKVETASDILSVFETHLAEAINILENVKEETIYDEKWTLRNGEYIILEQKKHEVIRSMVLNHIVHHRGQLSVYLRLLNIPVPGMYGPSADES